MEGGRVLGSTRGKEWEWTYHIAEHTGLGSTGDVCVGSRIRRPGERTDLRSESDGCVNDDRGRGRVIKREQNKETNKEKDQI